jgi:hypothetical protein
VRERWNIDPDHMLLTGMSDGGTFTLLSGLAEDFPLYPPRTCGRLVPPDAAGSR